MLFPEVNARVGALWMFFTLLCKSTSNEFVWSHQPATSPLHAANLEHRRADLFASLAAVVATSKLEGRGIVDLDYQALATSLNFSALLVLIFFDSFHYARISSSRNPLLSRNAVEVVHLFTILCSIACSNFSLITAVNASQKISKLAGEINSRKTFVRYISHEVRSPLSTSSLGLDCLLQLLQEESADRQELLDLATDCKSATQSAIQT
eukprot:gene36107-43784_t